MNNPIEVHDMTGIRCPMPIVQLSQIMAAAAPGDEILITADDPAFPPDVRAWCRRTGHELVELVEQDRVAKAHLRKCA